MRQELSVAAVEYSDDGSGSDVDSELPSPSPVALICEDCVRADNAGGLYTKTGKHFHGDGAGYRAHGGG